MGAIDQGKSYEDLLSQASEMSLGEGLSVSVLALSALIEMKERSARPKDLAVIPVLRPTLDELSRKR